jgi:hypothetical protein
VLDGVDWWRGSYDRTRPWSAFHRQSPLSTPMTLLDRGPVPMSGHDAVPRLGAGDNTRCSIPSLFLFIAQVICHKFRDYFVALAGGMIEFESIVLLVDYDLFAILINNGQ